MVNLIRRIFLNNVTLSSKCRKALFTRIYITFYSPRKIFWWKVLHSIRHVFFYGSRAPNILWPFSFQFWQVFREVFIDEFFYKKILLLSWILLLFWIRKTIRYFASIDDKGLKKIKLAQAFSQLDHHHLEINFLLDLRIHHYFCYKLIYLRIYFFINLSYDFLLWTLFLSGLFLFSLFISFCIIVRPFPRMLMMTS